ncbi:hypothetical protein [Streptomyces sp. NPDC001068]
MHATSPALTDSYPDAELWRLLAVTADTDRDESPFGWSDIPPVRDADR